MSKTHTAPADALSAEVERAAANRDSIDSEYTTKRHRLDYEIDAEISTAMAEGDRDRANALLTEKAQIREALPLLEDASRKASSIHDAALAARARRDAPTLAADHRYGVATRWNAWVAEGLKLAAELRESEAKYRRVYAEAAYTIVQPTDAATAEALNPRRVLTLEGLAARLREFLKDYSV